MSLADMFYINASCTITPVQLIQDVGSNVNYSIHPTILRTVGSSFDTSASLSVVDTYIASTSSSGYSVTSATPVTLATVTSKTITALTMLFVKLISLTTQTYVEFTLDNSTYVHRLDTVNQFSFLCLTGVTPANVKFRASGEVGSAVIDVLFRGTAT
jgi:hypothetical protein